MDFDVFTRLGNLVDQTWKRFDYDSAVFSDLAHDALAKAAIDDFDLPGFAARASSRLHVVGRASAFGDARVVGFETPMFSIELLVWHQGSTSIHEHAFCGAFQVLHGSSIHSLYRFEERRRVTTQVREGTVTALGTELLTAGDVRHIRPGRQGLCHSLFHLDAPSCSIVVRTPGELEHFPQLDYFPPSIALAIQNADDDPAVQHALDCVRMAWRLGDEELQLRALQAVLAKMDLFRALSVVMYMPPASWALRARISQEIPELFEGLEEAVYGTIQRNWLLYDCLKLRSSVHDPTQRFALAAAINAPTVDALRMLVQRRCPGEDPFEFLFRQVSALMDGGHLSVAWEPDNREEALLESFLRGGPKPATRAGDAEGAARGREPQRDDYGPQVHAVLAQDSVLRALRPIMQQLAVG